MQEAGGEGVGAGEEGHADGFVVGDALEGADEVGAFEVLFGGRELAWVLCGDRVIWGGGVCEGRYGGITDLGFVSPLVFELVKHVDVTEGAENTAHKTRFTNRTFHGVETAADDTFCADDAGDGAGHFAEDIVGACDGLFAGGDGVGDLFCGFEAGVDDGDGYHPDTMLDTWREHGDFREETLVGGTGHDLMGVSFRATVGADDHDSGAKVFDKVPAGARDGEDVYVCADIAEDFEGGVVLEEEVRIDADSADVLEHVGELHVLGIGPESVKAEDKFSNISEQQGGTKLTYRGRQSARCAVSGQTLLSDKVGQSGWCSNGNTHV